MSFQLPIYLDYNATTPVDSQVLEAMLPFFTHYFGNASSDSHAFGWQAAEAVKLAREKVASLIQSTPETIYFTAGATESANLAISGLIPWLQKKPVVISSLIEHKAVLDPLKRLENHGIEIRWIRPDPSGHIDPQKVIDIAGPDQVGLVCLMLANNEIGTITHLQTIAQWAKEKGALVMSDGVQALGKIPVNVDELGVDIMLFSAHKMYGPKGVGALYLRRKNPRVMLDALMVGGGHEAGVRPGTLNVPGIVGFGVACELAGKNLTAFGSDMLQFRDYIEMMVSEIGARVIINGKSSNRLPHVTSLTVKGLKKGLLLKKIKKLAVSAGSACTSANPEPSHVMTALGYNETDATNTIRISMGKPTTREEIEFATQYLKEIIGDLI